MCLEILKNIIDSKKTRLCFSADFTKTKDLIKWIQIMGPHICVLKTHIDILEDFEPGLILKLQDFKKKYNFLILEDRKFADIGKTFSKQFFGGLYKIYYWCDIITVHGLCAHSILETVSTVGTNVLIVSQMSNSNNIIDENYTQKCYDIAKKFPDNVLGFISQTKFVEDNSFMFFTPGIHLNSKSKKDQNYKTPSEAFRTGSDIIIVGSGLYESKNLEEDIIAYKKTN